MDFEQFQEEIKARLSELLPEKDLMILQVEKLQGMSYTGLSVRPEGKNIAVTLNLEEAYRKLQDGMAMKDLAKEMAVSARQSLELVPDLGGVNLSDYESMKKLLSVQLIPIAGNEEKLRKTPYRQIEDMALVYRIDIGLSGSALISRDVIKTLGVTQERLEKDALESASRNHPESLRSLNEVLYDMSGGAFDAPEDAVPLWVATMEGGVNGAAVLQYPDFLKRAAETVGGDFFVLPSSIHEVLLLPDDGSRELSELEEMVRSINEFEVAPQDKLTDTVYHYDSEEHLFEKARSFEERVALRETLTYGAEPEKETITVLMVEPGRAPYTIEMGTKLSDIQMAVQGAFETCYPFSDNACLVLNDEGKLNGMKLNRALWDEKGEIQDILAGPFFVAGLSENSFASLTPEQLEKYSNMFRQPEVFVRIGNRIMAIPVSEKKAQERATEKTTEAAAVKPKHRNTEHEER